MQPSEDHYALYKHIEVELARRVICLFSGGDVAGHDAMAAIRNSARHNVLPKPSGPTKGKGEKLK